MPRKLQLMLLVMLLTLNGILGGAEDSNDSSRKRVAAVVGSNVSLNCTSNNSVIPRWSKFKASIHIIPETLNDDTTIRSSYAARYSIVYYGDDVYALKITGAVVEDTGRFVCGDSVKTDRYEIQLIVIDPTCKIQSTFAETMYALPGQPNSSEIVCTLKYTRTKPPTAIICSSHQLTNVTFGHPSITTDQATYTTQVPATCSSLTDQLSCFGNFTVAGYNQSITLTSEWDSTLACTPWRLIIFVVGGCLAVLLLAILFIVTGISVRRCVKARNEFEVGTNRTGVSAPVEILSVRASPIADQRTKSTNGSSSLYARIDRRTSNNNNNSGANAGCDTYEKVKPVPEYRPKSGCAYINALDEEPEVFETADGGKRYVKNVNVKTGAGASKDSLNLKPILKKPTEQEHKRSNVTQAEPMYEPDELFVEKEDNVEFFDFDPYDKVKVDE